MEARAEGLGEGIRLLTAAKRVLAAAKKLDDEEAAALRRGALKTCLKIAKLLLALLPRSLLMTSRLLHIDDVLA